MREDVRSLNGGQKQKWLRENHAYVMEFYHRNGAHRTMTEFNLVYTTLERMLLRDERYREQAQSYAKYDDLQKVEILAKMAMEKSRETDRHVLELHHRFSRFTEIVADNISRQFLTPLLKLTIKLPPELEHGSKDPLYLNDFWNENERSELKDGA